MVVGYDNLYTAVFEFLHRIDIGNTAVNGNDQVRLLLNDLVHYLLGKSVAVFTPVRHDVLHIYLMASEIPDKNGCGRNAVTIVIAVNEDLAVPVDRIINDVDSLMHVIIKKRIVPDTVIFRQKLFY